MKILKKAILVILFMFASTFSGIIFASFGIKKEFANFCGLVIFFILIKAFIIKRKK